MKVTINKKNDRYFATVHYNSKVPKKVLIQKSWDSDFSKEVVLNYNILDSELNLIEKKYDLLNFEFELDKLINITDYYKLLITTEDDLIYPFYIDYDLFYNIKKDSNLYFYDLKDDSLINLNNDYKLYMLGNYGDKHKIKIKSLNKNRIFFNIPNKSKLESEFYYIIIEKDNKKIVKDYLGIYPDNHPLYFIVDLEDFGQYYKCVINTKHNYKVIKKIEISYLDKKINTSDNNPNYLFIPKSDFTKPIKLKIKSTIKENYINSPTLEKEFLIIKNLNNKNQISVDNFESFYNFELDTYFLSWRTYNLEKLSFKVNIENISFFTETSNLSIIKMKDFGFDKENLNVQIYAGVNNEYILLHKTKINNPFVSYKSNNFTPLISFDDYIDNKTQFVNINWSKPNFKYYSMIKIERNLHKSFITENTRPWIGDNELFLEKNVSEIKEEFNNFDEVIYDFKINEKLIGVTKNAPISYIKNNDGFLFLGERNNVNIPNWYIHKGEKIKISVKILDFWFKVKGENYVEFEVPYTSEAILDDDVKIIRNQNIQFGETGTLGNYNSLKNIGPSEVFKFYSEENKTFLETPKFDSPNTDFNNKSLYYYFSARSTSKSIYFKFKRSSNNKELLISIFKNKTEIFNHKFRFLGNDFEDNVLKLSRSHFNEEGEYTMNLTTINPYGYEGETKKINFFVFNERPETPIIKIPDEHYQLHNGKIIFNRKYFFIDIINNTHSEKYSGWNFKEVHFFFKQNIENDSYNKCPDYVIQSSKEDGTIRLINKTPFANLEYKCKVIAYDYSGNSSLPFEFEFIMNNRINILPEKLFTNNLESKFNWSIKKAEDSEGFYYFLSYSPDNIKEYEDSEPIKIESPYFVNNPENQPYFNLNINWLQSGSNYKMGFYKLCAYEWNYNFPDGVPEKFYSEVVEVNKTGNPSYPIFSKSKENVSVFNIRKSNENSYTDNLNSLEFTTIHDEELLEEDVTKTNEKTINGKFYKLQLIPPSKNTVYSCLLPIPTKVGEYTFDNIANKCNIENQEEGIWEIRFITVDKFKNNNEKIGYYLYKVVLIKNNPIIKSITPFNTNGSEYFSINSDRIGFFIDTSNFENIHNFLGNETFFDVKKIKIKFLSTPNNVQYEFIKDKDNRNFIEIMNPLTKDNKNKHNLDGRYLVSFTAIDKLGRESEPYEKTFYIDTKMEYEVSFLNENKFNTESVDLYLNVSSNVKKIYYKFLNNINDIDSLNFKNNTNLLEEKTKQIVYNSENIFGVHLQHNFNSKGDKYLAYWLQEESDNISDFQLYKFSLISSDTLIPIFDYSNKVLYTTKDNRVDISWNLTNKDINRFEVKLIKVELNEDGEYSETDKYMLEINNNRFIKVGENQNSFVDLGERKNISFELNEYSILGSGIYNLIVRGHNIYGTYEDNHFTFQILNTKNFINLKDEIINNKITLSSNKVVWKYLEQAESYEVSYDGVNYISTRNNFFFIDEERLKESYNGKYFIFLRFVNYFGIKSEAEKIEIFKNVKKIKEPVIECEEISIRNEQVSFDIIVEEPEISNYIYYSFDKKNWFVKEVSGRVNRIDNHLLTAPIPDGSYDIFVILVDENPINNNNYNKSKMVHKTMKVFAEKIEKPIFLNIKNGSYIDTPKNLFIENKNKNVEYFIFVNGKKVQEGHEISSSNLQTFNIVVKAKKIGRTEIVDLIRDGEFSINVFTGTKFILNLGTEKIIANINSVDQTIEIINMDNLKENEVVLYKEKNSNNWKTLSINDKLDLNIEYDFKIIYFKVNN